MAGLRLWLVKGVHARFSASCCQVGLCEITDRTSLITFYGQIPCLLLPLLFHLGPLVQTYQLTVTAVRERKMLSRVTDISYHSGVLKNQVNTLNYHRMQIGSQHTPKATTSENV